MTSRNEITGDQLKSKPSNKAFDDGWDGIDWDKKLKRINPMQNIDPLTGEIWAFPYSFKEVSKSELRELLGYVVGATVRQYHHSDMYEDAIITHVHSNGALDVVRVDGTKNGWSVNTCKPRKL